MEFGWPPGFWLGLCAAGVLLAHLVRRRARRRKVPFLPLWSAVVSQSRGGFGSTVVRLLDLFAVLLACAAVAFAAGVPYLPGSPGTVRDLVLVLDGGIELRAGERSSRLRKVAEAEVRRRAPGTRVVVVGVRGEGASVWSGTDRAQALREVRAHGPGWLPVKAAAGLELARGAARGLRDPDLVFCTYRPGRPEGFRLRPVIEPVMNAGVAALEVLADPEGRGRIARVGLRGDGPVEIEGHWRGTVEGAETVDVPLPPGGRVELRVVREGDGFAPDDRAYLLVPERKVPRVLVVAREQPSAFLAAALQALESTGVIEGPLGRTTPDRLAEAPGAAARTFDVLLFDRCTPQEPLEGARCVFVAPTPGPLPFKLGERSEAPAIFEVQRDHPVLAGIDLARVPPLHARAVLGGEALARAAPGPVLAAGPNWIALGFDPDLCVFAATPAYPLFLRNCIAHLAEVLPDPAPEFLAVGEPAPVPGIAEVEGLGPQRVGERLIGPAGFWELDGSTWAVNLLRDDLDLRAPTEEADPLPSVGEPATPDRSLAAMFGAAAVVLLLAAWWFFWRR
jgi:hypothetical protein